MLLDEFCETRDALEYEAIGNVPVEGKLERTKLNASNKSISAKHVFSKWNPDDDLDTIKDISFPFCPHDYAILLTHFIYEAVHYGHDLI